MYDQHIQQSIDQPDVVPNSVHSQLNRKSDVFSVPVSA